MKDLGTCRYCGEFRPLIKAHIFPESFYRPILDSGEVPTLYSTREAEYPRKAPIGVYDTGILCASCDGAMGLYDDYAKRILFDTPMEPYPHGPARLIQEYDYAKLKLFFLTLLWRAGISTHRMFEQVTLGPHEDRLLAMIKAGNPGSSEEYSVIVMSFDDPCARELGLQVFRARKRGALNYYRFNAAGYTFFIKVDARATVGAFRQVMLAPGGPLFIVERHWEDSPEYADVLRVVANTTEGKPQ